MPGTVLVLNTGSSSLKYQLVQPSVAVSVVDGIVERIGDDGGVADHQEALRVAFEQRLGLRDAAEDRAVERLRVQVGLLELKWGAHGVGDCRAEHGPCCAHLLRVRKSESVR